MRISAFLVLMTCACVALPRLAATEKRIAIIGAGIGGTSCAIFLRDLLGYEIDIDVYEKNEIGGRLATIQYDSDVLEMGGSVIHERNRYMRQFLSRFGLKEKNLNIGNLGKLGLYNGHNFDFITSDISMIRAFQFFWRYGISIFRVKRFVEDMLNDFDKIYAKQEMGEAYETVADMLYDINPLFLSYTNMTTWKCLRDEIQLSEHVINEVVQASLRVNYGQTTSAQAFLGSVSLAGMTDSLWAVDGGNKKIAEEALNYSRAILRKERATGVVQKDDSLEISSMDADLNVFSEDYDIVVIAAPLTEDSEDRVLFYNFDKKIHIPGRYHRTVTTMVKGKINSSYFGQKDDMNNMVDIISLDPSDIFNSISFKSEDSESKSKVWKIFSQRVLRSDEINELFYDFEIIAIKNWLAYPHYEHLGRTDRDSFVLSKNVFYINAIEWAASAMEMSVIGAKNVALLVCKSLDNEKCKTGSSLNDQKSTASAGDL